MASEKLEAKGIGSYLPIVIATTVFAFVPVAMQASCMGIFFPSMCEDYGVQTSSITIYMTFGGLILAVGMPLLGKLLAKHDIRIIVSVQIALVALCFLSLAFSGSIIQVVASGAILMAASVSMLGLSNPTLINRWFKDRAGFVIGLVAAFTGIGGVVFIQVGRAIMTATDYRTAFIAYAIIILSYAFRSHFSSSRTSLPTRVCSPTFPRKLRKRKALPRQLSRKTGPLMFRQPLRAPHSGWSASAALLPTWLSLLPSSSQPM